MRFCSNHCVTTSWDCGRGKKLPFVVDRVVDLKRVAMGTIYNSTCIRNAKKVAIVPIERHNLDTVSEFCNNLFVFHSHLRHRAIRHVPLQQTLPLVLALGSHSPSNCGADHSIAPYLEEAGRPDLL